MFDCEFYFQMNGLLEHSLKKKNFFFVGRQLYALGNARYCIQGQFAKTAAAGYIMC